MGVSSHSQRQHPVRPPPDLLPAGVEKFLVRAAHSSAPVLLEGETGTGKTHLARSIHHASGRAGGPFVRVDCATLPEGVIERELFGHVRGAYTGALDSRAGLIETASGGTLFLDEIGEVPLAVQAKLLSVMEEPAIRRVGATSEIPVNVRLVTATNRDLTELVDERAFRRDLYYRCRVLYFHLPPLRERRDELPILVDCLLKRIISGQQNGDQPSPPMITAETLEALRAHSWPGNLRELNNVLTHAVIDAQGGPIRPEHLPEGIPATTGVVVNNGTGQGASDRPSRYVAPASPAEEREHIVQALRVTAGNRTRAARQLGMSRQTLWIKIRFHRLEEI
jgi:transcriptional regulator with PAS, ATPase and Fis domain